MDIERILAMPPRFMRHRRVIEEGGEYTINDDVRLEEREPIIDPPDIDIQGEPWGWTKDGPKPRGWPGPDHSRDDPGPWDGAWERPEESGL